MDKKKIRDNIRFLGAVVFCWLYIPHIILYLSCPTLKKTIKKDLDRRTRNTEMHLGHLCQFLCHLHSDRYFRNLFYHRIGPVMEMLIGWWRPGDRYFVISKTTKIGEGAYFAHPFSTEINAHSIGRNFSCRNNTTIGNKFDGDNEHRAIIGNNVTIGVNVCIIGPVHIGDNVTIGAGSVVVKDIPNNCIVVGNPARILKYTI